MCFRGVIANIVTSLLTFFYPDYTVDPGIAPDLLTLVLRENQALAGWSTVLAQLRLPPVGNYAPP